MSRILLALLLGLALAGCAAHRPHLGPTAPVAATVDVTRRGDVWTADFHLDRPAPIWVFVRSSVTRDGELPWRSHDWVVRTPGVRLERRGRYDVLVGDNGAAVPAEVRLRFRPFAHDLLADSAPALAFSNGAVALFSRQFDLFALPDAAAVEQLPADLSTATIPYTRTRATFRDEAGPILYAGRRVPSVSLDDEDGTYLLFGPAEPIVSAGIATIIDPALPPWIGDALRRDTPAIIARLAGALGRPRAPNRP